MTGQKGSEGVERGLRRKVKLYFLHVTPTCFCKTSFVQLTTHFDNTVEIVIAILFSNCAEIYYGRVTTQIAKKIYIFNVVAQIALVMWLRRSIVRNRCICF